jgi:hypothetical protein
MAKHLTASLLMFSLIGTSAVGATSVHASMYRYTDENGQVVISSSVPQEATQRGYDILNNNGRVVTIIAPAPTDRNWPSAVPSNNAKTPWSSNANKTESC